MAKRRTADHEWRVILSMLPQGWQQQARLTGATRRRDAPLADPSALLRLLLFHVSGSSSLRSTVIEAAEAGLGNVSDVALLKQLKASVGWLQWLAAALAEQLRQSLPSYRGYRPRAIDSTHLQRPSSKGTDFRLHFTLDLLTLSCDWHELTDAHGSELLERAPVKRGDVLLGDRNFLRPAGVRAVRQAGGDVLVRLKWCHPAMAGKTGRAIHALARARRLHVGEVGDWDAALLDAEHPAPTLPGRIVAVKLPAPLAARNRSQLEKRHRKKKKGKPDQRSLEAAGYVMLWTTLSREVFDAAAVLAWYRFRWQVELAFKRLKQLLRLGHVPHKDEQAARGWIQAKLVLALLLETLYRHAAAISPWGYRIAERAAAEPVEVDAPVTPLAAQNALPGAATAGTT